MKKMLLKGELLAESNTQRSWELTIGFGKMKVIGHLVLFGSGGIKA